jgi:hypothetical protein
VLVHASIGVGLLAPLNTIADTTGMQGPRRFLLSLTMSLTLAGSVSAASAEASTYVGQQVGPAHGVVMLSVSARRITVSRVAFDCRKPGSALPGAGSGAIARGRFSVKIGYEYYSGRHAAKPIHLWARLTGAVHGATITGALATPKSGPCSGGHYTAAVAGRVASGGGGSPSTVGAGEENEGEESSVPGAPFAEAGNYEAAFNREWEAKIEELCHSKEVQQASGAPTCSTFVPAEKLTVPQAE